MLRTNAEKLPSSRGKTTKQLLKKTERTGKTKRRSLYIGSIEVLQRRSATPLDTLDTAAHDTRQARISQALAPPEALPAFRDKGQNVVLRLPCPLLDVSPKSLSTKIDLHELPIIALKNG